VKSLMATLHSLRAAASPRPGPSPKSSALGRKYREEVSQESV